MKKQIFILSLAMFPILIMAQNKRQPDSLLVYSFTPNGDSILNVIDARTYNSEGLLQTRKQTIYKDYVICREKGVYNATYSYSDNGNERTTTILYLDDLGDTIEREIFSYAEDKFVYVYQMYHLIDGKIAFGDFYIKTFKGIRNYESNEMLDLFMYSGATIFDYAEIPLYFADTITLEKRLDGVWKNVGEYIFTFNQDNTPNHLLATGILFEYDIDNYYFFYDENGQCVRIDRYINVSMTDTLKDLELMPLSSGPNQKIIYLSTTSNVPYDLKCKYIFNYDNDGNLLSRFHYDVSDSLDVGVANDKYYYIYNQTSNIQEYNTNPISIFPNPAQSQFTVTNTENAAVYLYNILGQKIKQVTSTEENTVIQTEDLSAGMYVLKVEKGNAVVTKKVQVVK